MYVTPSLKLFFTEKTSPVFLTVVNHYTHYTCADW